MPNIRQEALNRIFKEGIGSVSKRDLDQLFKEGVDLYRNDQFPIRLIEKGFSRGQSRHLGDSFSPKGEPPGLYWARDPKDLGYLVSQDPDLRLPVNIKGIINPKARYGDFSEEEWEKFLSLPGRNIRRGLERRYDLVEFPDLVGRDAMGHRQVVQFRPGQVLAKHKDLYKILGLGGALGTGAAMETLNSDEAQASPLGKKFVKVGSEVLLPVSSTAKDLIGTELWGKVVKAVTKGKGKERFIIFTDGTARKADAQYLNDLMRVRGDVKYLDRLKRQSQKGKVRQVEKSVNLRVSASNNFNLRPATGSKTAPNLERGHQQRVKELGITPTQKVGAWKGKTYITLPKEYAEILQRQGLIRIDKEIK